MVCSDPGSGQLVLLLGTLFDPKFLDRVRGLLSSVAVAVTVVAAAAVVEVAHLSVVAPSGWVDLAFVAVDTEREGGFETLVLLQVMGHKGTPGQSEEMVEHLGGPAEALNYLQVQRVARLRDWVLVQVTVVGLAGLDLCCSDLRWGLEVVWVETGSLGTSLESAAVWVAQSWAAEESLGTSWEAWMRRALGNSKLHWKESDLATFSGQHLLLVE